MYPPSDKTGAPFPPSNVDGDLGADMLSFHTSVRRPGYFLRGAPVSPQLAREIIARSAFALQEWFRDHCNENYWDYQNGCPVYESCERLSQCTPFLDFVHFDNWWFEEGHDPMGWCHFDGTLGGDGITQKYPDMVEYIQDWAPFAAAYPQVELMVLTLRLDERFLYYRPGTKYIPRYLCAADGKLVKKYADVGFHIHDGRMTLLGPREAYRLFLDFQARYPYDEEAQRRREVLPDREEFLAWAKDFLSQLPFEPPFQG